MKSFLIAVALLFSLGSCGPQSDLRGTPTAEPSEEFCLEAFAQNDEVTLRRCADGSSFSLNWSNGTAVGPIGPALIIGDVPVEGVDWPATVWRRNGALSTISLAGSATLPTVTYSIELRRAVAIVTVSLTSPTTLNYKSLGILTSEGVGSGIIIPDSDSPRCWPTEPGPSVPCRSGTRRSLGQHLRGEEASVMLALQTGERQLSFRTTANSANGATGLFVGYPEAGSLIPNVDVISTIVVSAGTDQLTTRRRLSAAIDSAEIQGEWAAGRYYRRALDEQETPQPGLSYILTGLGTHALETQPLLQQAVQSARLHPESNWALYLSTLGPVPMPDAYPDDTLRPWSCEGQPCSIPDLRNPEARQLQVNTVAALPTSVFTTAFVDLRGQLHSGEGLAQLVLELSAASPIPLVFMNAQLTMAQLQDGAIANPLQPANIDDVAYWLAQNGCYSPNCRQAVSFPDNSTPNSISEALIWLAGGQGVYGPGSAPIPAPELLASPRILAFPLDSPANSPPGYWLKGSVRGVFNWSNEPKHMPVGHLGLMAGQVYPDLLRTDDSARVDDNEQLYLEPRSARLVLTPVD